MQYVTDLLIASRSAGTHGVLSQRGRHAGVAGLPPRRQDRQGQTPHLGALRALGVLAVNPSRGMAELLAKRAALALGDEWGAAS